MSLRIVAGMIIVMCIGIVGTADYAQAAEKKLIKFKLEDRSSKMKTEKSFIGTSFILVASDKVGSKYTEAWMTKIQKGLNDKKGAKPAPVMAVADLSAVPSLMRGAVKRILPKPDKINLLLDWEGVFTKAYGFKENKSNLLVFSNSGVLIFQDAVTKLDPKKADGIITMIASEQSKK